MKTIRQNALCVFALALITLVSIAGAGAQQLTPKLQNAVGHWQIVDSDGTPGGQAEIYLENGKLFGRVTQVRPGRTPQDVCDKCSGEYKNQLILGMVIMRNFHPDGDDWVGGTVVDPENGKEYRGKIWAEGNDKLHLRGYIGIPLLGRTEVWTRIPFALLPEEVEEQAAQTPELVRKQWLASRCIRANTRIGILAV